MSDSPRSFGVLRYNERDNDEAGSSLFVWCTRDEAEQLFQNTCEQFPDWTVAIIGNVKIRQRLAKDDARH